MKRLFLTSLIIGLAASFASPAQAEFLYEMYHADPILNYEAAEEELKGSAFSTNLLQGQNDLREDVFTSVVSLEVTREAGMVFEATEKVPGSVREVAKNEEELMKILRERGAKVGYSDEQIEAARLEVLPYLETHKVRGSGFVFTTNGYILTNAHVVFDPVVNGPSKNIILSFSNSSQQAPKCQRTGKVLEYDLSLDLALIQQDQSVDSNCNPTGVTASPITSSFIQMRGFTQAVESITPGIGEETYVLGFPTIGGGAIHLTQGVVSGYLFADVEGTEFIAGIKTSADINPGNSGGAALDRDGMLVGIPTFIAFNSESGSKLNVIVPLHSILAWLRNIARTKAYSFPIGSGAEDRVEVILENAIQQQNQTQQQQQQQQQQSASNTPVPQQTQQEIRQVSQQADVHFDQKNRNSIIMNMLNIYGPNVNCFTDVDKSVPNKYAICWAKSMGLISGYPDGSFQGGASINRAEMMKILMGDRSNLSIEKYSSCFSDVHRDWFSIPICFAKENQIISGYADGSFRPTNIVNKAEGLKMIFNSMGFDLSNQSLNTPYADVRGDEWFAPYVAFGSQYRYIDTFAHPGPNYNAWGHMTRADFVETMFRAATGFDATANAHANR